MGFHSYLTADTGESIMNTYSSSPSQTVYLLRPDGLPPVAEPAYEGYGVFGGLKAFDWLARFNLPAEEYEALNEEGRSNAGADMVFEQGKPGIPRVDYPLKFSFDQDADYATLPASRNCPRQGFFDEEPDGDDEEHVDGDEPTDDADDQE